MYVESPGEKNTIPDLSDREYRILQYKDFKRIEALTQPNFTQSKEEKEKARKEVAERPVSR